MSSFIKMDQARIPLQGVKEVVARRAGRRAPAVAGASAERAR